MSATTSTERYGLPAVLDFDKVFVTVFWVLSEEYDVTLPNVASNVSWDEYDPAEVRRLFDDAILQSVGYADATPNDPVTGQMPQGQGASIEGNASPQPPQDPNAGQRAGIETAAIEMESAQ